MNTESQSKGKKSIKGVVAVLALCLLWIGIHFPGITYGTSDVPLHASYLTADEQSPINGALHILEARNPLELRNVTTLYYGPLFAVIAIPAAVLDFAIKFISGQVSGALAYKDFVVWNWGGILMWGRIFALITGFTGLWATYLLFRTRTFNPSGKKWIAVSAVALVGLNYLYFEYTNFFRHWAFMLAILIWQIYLVVRIMEVDTGRRKYWIWQAVFATVIFGISYIGLIFQVMWLPVIYVWMKNKDRSRLKEFWRYVLGALLGIALMIWWYPYGFTRTASLAGIGSSEKTGAVLTLANAPAGHSFAFYAEVIFVNNFLLIIGGVILLAALLKKKKIHSQYWFWVLVVTAAAQYVFFSIPAHHETRYMVPAVTCLALLVTAIYSWAAAEWPIDRPVMRVAGLCIYLSLLLSVVEIAGWERMMAAGPPERRSIVPSLVAWQKADPKTKVLAIQNWPFGYVHSADAYDEYVSTHEKSGFDLWKYILTLPPPSGITPINVYYKPLGSVVTVRDREEYDHIVVLNPAKLDKDLLDISPNDQFDFKPWTVWNYAEYQDSFTILK